MNPFNKGGHVLSLKKKYKPHYTVAIGGSRFDEDMFREADISISVCNGLECATHHVPDFFAARNILEKEFWR